MEGSSNTSGSMHKYQPKHNSSQNSTKQPAAADEQKPSQSSSAHQPPMRLLVISKEGAQFLRMEESTATTPSQLVVDEAFPVFPLATGGKFAPYQGEIAVIADEIGLHFIDTTTGKIQRMIMATGINSMLFSPRDSYLITCEKFVQGNKNLNVWSVQTGKEVLQFEWKKASKEGPRSIKFSQDEQFVARLASKTSIEVYKVGQFDQPFVTLNANYETLAKKNAPKGRYWFDGFEFIPADFQYGNNQHQYLMAWQNCEGLSEKQEGGIVYVFDMLAHQCDKPKFSIICSKAQDIIVRPSPTGYAVLIWSQNFVDSSGKSYYGEHSC